MIMANPYNLKKIIIGKPLLHKLKKKCITYVIWLLNTAYFLRFNLRIFEFVRQWA